MPQVAWGALATLTVFVLTNIGMMIYWSARISTILERVQTDLRDIVSELKAARHVYVSKEELAVRVAQSDQEHAELRRRLEEHNH